MKKQIFLAVALVVMACASVQAQSWVRGYAEDSSCILNEILPIGTKINNKAGIYFDFNDPIITNTTWHTVAKDLVITAIIDPQKTPNSLTINVLPNPFTEHATFELLEFAQPFNSESNQPKFELYDALSRLLRSEKITNARFDFHRKDLSSGLYFFNMTSNGKVLGRGKLVIQ